MSARLGYDVSGPASGDPDAPVLLLGSSLGVSRALWRPQLEPFAQRLRVIRFDHRAHGTSEEPPGPYSIADLGQDVLALLDDLGVRRFSYAGVSLGGMVGIWLATNAPDRVDRLALCCTTAYLPPAQAWRDRAATVLASGTSAIADAVVARWFTPGFAADHPGVVAGMRADLLAAPPAGYAACCQAIAAMDQREDLHRITAPTLVLAGAEDLAIPPDHSERLVEGVPKSRLALVHGAHLATLEAATESTALLLDHLLPGEGGL